MPLPATIVNPTTIGFNVAEALANPSGALTWKSRGRSSFESTAALSSPFGPFAHSPFDALAMLTTSPPPQPVPAAGGLSGVPITPSIHAEEAVHVQTVVVPGGAASTPGAAPSLFPRGGVFRPPSTANVAATMTPFCLSGGLGGEAHVLGTAGGTVTWQSQQQQQHDQETGGAPPCVEELKDNAATKNVGMHVSNVPTSVEAEVRGTG